MDVRCKELEAELEAERQARARSERSKNDSQYESDELQERLDQHAAATQAQMEANKKKDAEVAKLRREIDQLKLTFEAQATALKSEFRKHDLTPIINGIFRERRSRFDGIARAN